MSNRQIRLIILTVILRLGSEPMAKIEIFASKKDMDFQTLSPFGVAAQGSNISDLTDRDIDTLKSTLAHNGFVVFRQQSASDRDFVDFLARLGALTDRKSVV